MIFKKTPIISKSKLAHAITKQRIETPDSITKSFTKKINLQRHKRLIHAASEPEEVMTVKEEVEDDEIEEVSLDTITIEPSRLVEENNGTVKVEMGEEDIKREITSEN